MALVFCAGIWCSTSARHPISRLSRSNCVFAGIPGSILEHVMNVEETSEPGLWTFGKLFCSLCSGGRGQTGTQYFVLGKQTSVLLVQCASGTFDHPPGTVRSCQSASTLIHPAALTTGCLSGGLGWRTACVELSGRGPVAELLAASNCHHRAEVRVVQRPLDSHT